MSEKPALQLYVPAIESDIVVLRDAYDMARKYARENNLKITDCAWVTYGHDFTFEFKA